MTSIFSNWKNLCKEHKIVPNVRRKVGGGKEGGHKDEHLYRLSLLLVKLFLLFGVLTADSAHLLTVPNLPYDAAVPEDDQTQGNEVLRDHQR